ncbi:ATPase, AAA family domain-containing protein, putative [Eimeria tenella]|uniref:ATPase, AAA family domain-containing protein, putative n=1 Tax=Eimeria tenella TaxID=5802 RepID=U6KJU3_EIMTE|nr:ATPase, AAA family domain-containing protein, putative [Eimeria tenella]CDJ37071.1 ATPase, AAA family domain-containing protein, putative [Eimeria tenella]|eukprot:XP_013227909.1 ATPase, AAA family domain-containing protein, putative [Eimeria tenella]
MYFPSFGGSSAVPSAALPNAIPKKEDDGESITGKFDPSALERGAKALKELDSSPNAARAFEVIKLQELSKQKELQKQIEQIAAARAQAQTERTKTEGEERRKTIDHQQEQERVTAQYKAKLEAEAYQKKLQDQQRQNEEWLRQQHKQFLLQEEQRKKTEAEMLEMRRQQLREEKALEEKLQKEKIREEAKGRILQERENIDVHLRAMRARAAEERKTKLESLEKTFGSLGAAFSALLADKAKLTALVGSVTALAAGIYGARAAASIAARYVESRIGKPPLVRETSRWTFSGGPFSLLRPWRPRGAPQTKENIVLEKDLFQKLEFSKNSLLTTKAHNSHFRHLLLHGPPGTGKTLFARTLARESGMDYAIMTGGDVGPLGPLGASEINKLFNWAQKSRKGLILFIDEADAFLRQGRAAAAAAAAAAAPAAAAAAADMSEHSRNALSAFLHHTGTETNKFCLILATNCKEILDKRYKMLQQFMDRYIRSRSSSSSSSGSSGKSSSNSIVVDERINDEFLKDVADKTEGFSGRQLAKLVLAMQAAAYGSGTNALTLGLAEAVLKWRLKSHNEEQQKQQH